MAFTEEDMRNMSQLDHNNRCAYDRARGLTDEQGEKHARDKTIDDMMMRIRLTRRELKQLLENTEDKYYWLRYR